MSEAATVAAALREIEQHPPQWVLLDLMLPDGCGIDVLRKVRKDHQETHVCVITGAGPEKQDEARRAGATHVFVKPLEVQDLMAILPHT